MRILKKATDLCSRAWNPYRARYTPSRRLTNSPWVRYDTSMPRGKKKLTEKVTTTNPRRLSRDEVKIAVKNAAVLAENFLEGYLEDANRKVIDSDGKPLKLLSKRVLGAYTTEMMRPLLEMVNGGLLLREELLVALLKGAAMVAYKDE